MHGKLSARESPKTNIQMKGTLTDSQTFEAIIDTGFTGFVSMPLSVALPLGLVLYATATFTLADGSKENTFLCLGTAIMDGRKEVGLVSLSKGNDILVGTEFLSKFESYLVFDYKSREFDLKIKEKSQYTH